MSRNPFREVRPIFTMTRATYDMFCDHRTTELLKQLTVLGEPALFSRGRADCNRVGTCVFFSHLSDDVGLDDELAFSRLPPFCTKNFGKQI